MPVITEATARRLFNAFGPDACEAGLFSAAELKTEADALMRTLRQDYTGVDGRSARNVVVGWTLVEVIETWITTAYPAPEEADESAAREALVGRIAATGLLSLSDVARIAGRQQVAEVAPAAVA